MIRDIPYCMNDECPYTDCLRHMKQLKDEQSGSIISIANFAGKCKQYMQIFVGDVSRSALKFADGLYITEDN